MPAGRRVQETAARQRRTSENKRRILTEWGLQCKGLEKQVRARETEAVTMTGNTRNTKGIPFTEGLKIF